MLIFVAKIVKILNTPPKNKQSVCIVSEHLAAGGAERCAALLSQFLDKNKIEVHHLLVMDRVEYPFAGKLFNMGLLKKNNSFFNRLYRFWNMYRFFRNNSFDYIIDARVKHHYFQEWIITKLIYNAPLIVWVHSYMTHLYFPITKLVARIIYSKSKIVAVSDKIKAKIYANYGFDDVTTMYNPIDFSAIENSLDTDEKLDFEYIIAAGSLKNNIKQFDVLLSCYHQSILPSKGIKLVFMGDGVLLKHLKQLACDLHLQDNVVFLGRKQNPFPFYKEAKCTVLTSKNEGFPMVLIESLATGTPVISYDCDSGPSEIIQNGVNGWLVADQNPQKMTDALNEMVENEKLYLHCKVNSKQSVASFSLESIGENWLTLLK